MNIKVLAPHKPANKMHQVRFAMIELGAPTIRVVQGEDGYIAIEGSHRIACAYSLEVDGVAMRLQVIEPDQVVEHDFDDFDSPCLAGEIVAWLRSDKINTEYEGVPFMIPYVFCEESVEII